MAGKKKRRKGSYFAQTSIGILSAVWEGKDISVIVHGTPLTQIVFPHEEPTVRRLQIATGVEGKALKKRIFKIIKRIEKGKLATIQGKGGQEENHED